MAENPKTEWFPAIQKGWFSASSGWTKSLRTSLDGETNGQFTGYIAYMHTFVHRYVGGGHSRKWTQEGESSGQEVAGGDVVRVLSCIADAPWIFKPGSYEKPPWESLMHWCFVDFLVFGKWWEATWKWNEHDLFVFRINFDWFDGGIFPVAEVRSCLKL